MLGVYVEVTAEPGNIEVSFGEALKSGLVKHGVPMDKESKKRRSKNLKAQGFT